MAMAGKAAASGAPLVIPASASQHPSGSSTSAAAPLLAPSTTTTPASSPHAREHGLDVGCRSNQLRLSISTCAQTHTIRMLYTRSTLCLAAVQNRTEQFSLDHELTVNYSLIQPRRCLSPLASYLRFLHVPVNPSLLTLTRSTQGRKYPRLLSTPALHN